jgi:hypothetical protein
MNICYGLPFEQNNVINYEYQGGYFQPPPFNAPNDPNMIVPLGYNPYAPTNQQDLSNTERRMEQQVQYVKNDIKHAIGATSQDIKKQIEEIDDSITTEVKSFESSTKKEFDDIRTELNDMKYDISELEKKTKPQTPLYVKTEGDTVHYYETNDTQPITSQEYGRAINKVDTYPFKVEYTNQIKQIYVKGKNMTLTFTCNSIVCSEFILIEIINDVMNIWPYEERVRKTFSSNGKTKFDGYVIKDINRNGIKTSKQFKIKQWKCHNMVLSTVEIYSESCRIMFNDVLSSDLNIMVYGRNNTISIPNKKYNTFRIDLNEEVLLDMNGSQINNINAILKGKSVIRYFTAIHKFFCEIHGLSYIGTYEKEDNCVVDIKSDNDHFGL